MHAFSASTLIALFGLTCVLAVPSTNEGSIQKRHVGIIKRQSSTVDPKSVVPLTPSTTIAGQPLLIQWQATSKSEWKSMEISLMTGSNQHMTELWSIVKGIDGTSQTSYNWTVPQVSPYSAIYFFQFTHSGQNPTWTTRFAIADSNGKTTTPPQANQPEGGSPPIPWGEGKLVSTPSSSSAPSQSDSSSSVSYSAASVPSTSASATYVPIATTSPPLAVSSSLRSSSSSSTTSAPTATNSSNQSKSSASSLKGDSLPLLVAGLIAGFSAFAL